MPEKQPSLSDCGKQCDYEKGVAALRPNTSSDGFAAGIAGGDHTGSRRPH
jgi:hypothetical protein